MKRSLSRRNALAHLGAGSLGAVLAAGGMTVRAQEATPVGMQDLPPGLVGWVEGWETLDIDKIVEAYAEDGVHEDMAQNELFSGRDEIRSHLEPLSTEFTDPSSQFTHIVLGDQGVSVEWTFQGTYTGQVPGFPPGTGEEILIRGVSVIELTDGQIQREREYYDVFGILQQLGLVPAPSATPEA